MNKGLIIGGIAIVLLVVVGSYVYTQMKQQSHSARQQEQTGVQGKTVPQQAATQASQTGAMQQSDAVEIAVTASNFSFDPKEIRVKQGEIVTITLTSKEGMHNFVIDEFNVRTKVIGAGLSDIVTVTADKKGTFEYYCSVGRHREMGMVGKLIVE